jgi:hypothetical protein
MAVSWIEVAWDGAGITVMVTAVSWIEVARDGAAITVMAVSRIEDGRDGAFMLNGAAPTFAQALRQDSFENPFFECRCFHLMPACRIHTAKCCQSNQMQGNRIGLLNSCFLLNWPAWWLDLILSGTESEVNVRDSKLTWEQIDRLKDVSAIRHKLQ